MCVVCVRVRALCLPLLLTGAALEKLDFVTAERAFVKMGDYSGVQLVKRLNQLGDKAIQRAEVLVYLKRFDEAEKAYKDMDRLDLAIDMRARLGDWFTVMRPSRDMCDNIYTQDEWHDIYRVVSQVMRPSRDIYHDI